MAHQGFSQGQVPAAYVKALRSEAEATHVSLHLDLEAAALRDETTQVALSTYLGALEGLDPAFIDRAHGRLLDPAQRAMWSRLLRRASTPLEAFDLLGSEEVLGSASFHVQGRAADAVWGRVEVRHDPRLEEVPALQRARAAVLGLIPRLYGYDRIEVEGDHREVRLRWKLAASPAPWILSSLLGLALLLGWQLGAISPWWLAALPPFALALQRTLAARNERAREARALRFRGQVLERQLELGEEADQGKVGDFAGQVVAGLYRVEARMGTGASGVVYRARRITDGLLVAIKLLRAATAHDAVASDRLRREAEALGLAWHPNVVEVLDHGMLPDGTSYLVMEALEGHSLADRLQQRSPLSLAETVAIGAELCAALIAVHAAGVIHRDVKPDNVFLLHAAGEPVRLKLLDFGIARVEWEELRITRSGGPLGTPGFMAPEQERGETPAPAADVYSLGAVLRACGARQITLHALIERCLREAPEQRPSLREVLLELGKLCSERPPAGTLGG